MISLKQNDVVHMEHPHSGYGHVNFIPDKEDGLTKYFRMKIIPGWSCVIGVVELIERGMAKISYGNSPHDNYWYSLDNDYHKIFKVGRL